MQFNKFFLRGNTVSLLILLVNIVSSCSLDNQKQYGSSFYYPKTKLFDTIPYPKNNQFSEARVELGRKLFYDPFLSTNGEVSCASCHLPEKAFTDGSTLSPNGVTKVPQMRNAPTLVNLAWHKGYFWEGGSHNLESQVIGPLANEHEMGFTDLRELVVNINKHDEYRELVNNAYGADTIILSHILRAISAFERTIISENSKYDQVKRGEKSFTRLENRGYEVFLTKCETCHKEPFLTDLDYHNNGLDSSWTNDTLEGTLFARYRITRDSADYGAYKTPTLRNIMLTAPYMHDGRFSSIDEVLRHYSSQVKPSFSLDERLVGKDKFYGIRLDLSEKIALKAFLNTLTDSTLITNTKLKNPFNEDSDNATITISRNNHARDFKGM